LQTQPMGNLPTAKTMLAIVTTSLNTIEKQNIPIPALSHGEVLVKMRYAPVNPSDIYSALGSYSMPGTNPTFPHTNGFEGTGTVVASGGGFLGGVYALCQFRVSFANPVGVSWTEYVVINPMNVVPLPSSVSDKEAASSLVNPLTVIAMLELSKNRVMVHTAANSALGLMLLRASPLYNVTIVCVVRGEKNRVDLIKKHGHPSRLVIQSDQPGFSSELKKVVESTGATIAFDAISGSMTSDIFQAMPSSSQTFIYGMLSGQPPPEDFVSTGTKLASGFHLKNWLDEGGLPRKIWAIGTMLSMIKNELSTTYEKELDFHQDPELLDQLHQYSKHQKGGKILLRISGNEEK